MVTELRRYTTLTHPEIVALRASVKVIYSEKAHNLRISTVDEIPGERIRSGSG